MFDKIIVSFIRLVVLLLAFYLVISFGIADMNVFSWHPVYRFSIVVLTAATMFLISLKERND